MEEPKSAPGSEEDKKKSDAPEGEDKKTKESPEVEPEEKPKEKPEERIGDVLGLKDKKEKPRTVPESVFIELKNELKGLKKGIAEEVAKAIQSNATSPEVSEGLEKIAEKHDVDVGFLNELAKSLKSSLKDEMKNEMKPIYERETQEKINKVFKEHFKRTLEAMPEYKDIANKDVIKKLSLLPENSNKTFAKILEDAYGHLIKGKKTLESPKGGKEEPIGEIDYKKAKIDTKYYEQIMASPELKRKYNKDLPSRLNL